MLTLTRKVGEAILIGDGIEVVVRAVKGRAVRVGIATPAGVRVVRAEILDSIREETRRAAVADAPAIVRRLRGSERPR